MTQEPRGRTGQARILVALLRVGRGDRTGIAGFADTVPAFLASLVPLITLPLFAGLATFARGEISRAMADVLASVCALLLPPAISHALARRWNREAHWLRFAVAFNWTQFALSVLFMLLLGGLGAGLAGAGAAAQSNAAVGLVILLCLALVGYALWLHWFVAREGLAVSGGRAALLVAAVYVGTLAVLIVRGALAMERG